MLPFPRSLLKLATTGVEDPDAVSFPGDTGVVNAPPLVKPVTPPPSTNPKAAPVGKGQAAVTGGAAVSPSGPNQPFGSNWQPGMHSGSGRPFGPSVGPSTLMSGDLGGWRTNAKGETVHDTAFMTPDQKSNWAAAIGGKGFTERHRGPGGVPNGHADFYAPDPNNPGGVRMTGSVTPDSNDPSKRVLTSRYGTGSVTQIPNKQTDPHGYNKWLASRSFTDTDAAGNKTTTTGPDAFGQQLRPMVARQQQEAMNQAVAQVDKANPGYLNPNKTMPGALQGEEFGQTPYQSLTDPERINTSIGVPLKEQRRIEDLGRLNLPKLNWASPPANAEQRAYAAAPVNPNLGGVPNVPGMTAPSQPRNLNSSNPMDWRPGFNPNYNPFVRELLGPGGGPVVSGDNPQQAALEKYLADDRAAREAVEWYNAENGTARVPREPSKLPEILAQQNPLDFSYSRDALGGVPTDLMPVYSVPPIEPTPPDINDDPTYTDLKPTLSKAAADFQGFLSAAPSESVFRGLSSVPTLPPPKPKPAPVALEPNANAAEYGAVPPVTPAAPAAPAAKPAAKPAAPAAKPAKLPADWKPFGTTGFGDRTVPVVQGWGKNLEQAIDYGLGEANHAAARAGNWLNSKITGEPSAPPKNDWRSGFDQYYTSLAQQQNEAYRQAETPDPRYVPYTPEYTPSGQPMEEATRDIEADALARRKAVTGTPEEYQTYMNGLQAPAVKNSALHFALQCAKFAHAVTQAPTGLTLLTAR